MTEPAILRPADGVLAFYDGRVEGDRFGPGPNWVDEGAISLGIASYAILDGADALVYDTHVSVEHGRLIRETAGSRGCARVHGPAQPLAPRPHRRHRGLRRLRGAGRRAHAELLARNREEIEAGALEGPPAISPAGPADRRPSRSRLKLGSAADLELIRVDIHSDDAVGRLGPRGAAAPGRRHGRGHGHLRR